MAPRKRARIGDIIEIKTSKGYGYFQYVSKDATMGDLIRVLPGVHSKPLTHCHDLASATELYFVYFPLGAGIAKGLMRIVGSAPVPEGADRPARMKRPIGRARNGNVLSWAITENGKDRFASELSDDEQRLSLSVIWNDTLLAERIADGWTPQKQFEASE
jgi:hypothetical protein